MSTPAVLTKTSINNQYYTITICVFSSNISLTSPSTIDNDLDHALFIPNGSIIYVGLENSMVDIIPKAEFEIIDNDFILTSRLKKVNTRFKLTIFKNGIQIIDTTWIVQKYDVLNFSKNNAITYKISCILDCAIPLYTLCNYATSNDLYNGYINEKEDPYKIIKSILSNVNFNMYPGDYINNEGLKVRNRYSLPVSSQKVQYITYHNTYAIDAVKFLLSRAVSSLILSPPAYLIYNIKDNKGFITTRENLFKSTSIKEQPDSTKNNYFSISEHAFGPQYQMTELKTDCIGEDHDFGGIENSKAFYNYNFYTYNHIDRKWGNNLISKNNINEILTLGMNQSTEESVFNSSESAIEDIEITNRYNFPSINEKNGKLYDVLKHLELFSSNIQFIIDGNLDLDVGQVITVKETANFNTKTEMYNGKWLIIKIKHSFFDKIYKTEIICARTYYTKAL